MRLNRFLLAVPPYLPVYLEVSSFTSSEETRSSLRPFIVSISPSVLSAPSALLVLLGVSKSPVSLVLLDYPLALVVFSISPSPPGDKSSLSSITLLVGLLFLESIFYPEAVLFLGAIFFSRGRGSREVI